jgi:hypothetical protein
MQTGGARRILRSLTHLAQLRHESATRTSATRAMLDVPTSDSADASADDDGHTTLGEPTMAHSRTGAIEQTERPQEFSAALLQLAASGYERAQRDRIRYGEQLRAILQRRDPRWDIEMGDDVDADELLREIRGSGGGPVPILGRLYAAAWAQEREMGAQMDELITLHPAWPWLRDVRGVGGTLASRLLSRLDVTRAPSPASFWAYCGLGTVAAEELVCDRCGTHAFVAPGTRLLKPHLAPASRERCAGVLRMRGPASHVRVAQSRPRRGEVAPYDLDAKAVCYLIGVSFVRCGGPYRDVYDERKAHLVAMHPAWPAKRVHLAAARATVKRFLADLWVAWHEALHDPAEHGGTTGITRMTVVSDPKLEERP